MYMESKKHKNQVKAEREFRAFAQAHWFSCHRGGHNAYKHVTTSDGPRVASIHISGGAQLGFECLIPRTAKYGAFDEWQRAIEAINNVLKPESGGLK